MGKLSQEWLHLQPHYKDKKGNNHPAYIWGVHSWKLAYNHTLPFENNETKNELNPDNEDSFYVPKVCSSEGSPCSRSDSGSRKSVSDEEHSGDEDTRKEYNEDQEHDTNVLEDNPLAESEKEDRLGNGAATTVYISPQHNPKQNAGNENNAFEDNFSSNYELNDNSPTINDNDNETKGGWATFEDQEDKACEFATFLSKDEQDKILNKRTNMFSFELPKQISIVLVKSVLISAGNL